MSFKFKVSGFKLFPTHLYVFLCLLIAAFTTKLNAQTNFPKNYFSSPLLLPINLAGNFGEIRTGHFHSGIDIKTNNKEGELVLAAADGYVVRIKISATGFGKAIYVKHPNGFTTVYGHLQRFNDSIQHYIETVQYKKESYEIDETLDSSLFPVKQGELIAYSGNTGSSEGPHLHFEIRNSITEHPINPLLFGYQIQDSIAPTFSAINIYNIIESKNGLITNVLFSPTLLKSDTVLVSNKTVFTIETSDKMNDTTGNLTVDKIELSVDGKNVYTYHFDEFGFDESRYVNANIDYAEKIIADKKIILLYRLPGNDFSMFKNDTAMKGIVNLDDEKFHAVEIKVSDFNGNVSLKKFILKNKNYKKEKCCPFSEVIPTVSKGDFISWKKTPVLNLRFIKISFAPKAFYNNYSFDFLEANKMKGMYSPVFMVGDEKIPIHTFMNLSIKTKKLSTANFSKALIVAIDKKGTMTAELSTFENGWVTGKIKHFGKFAVTIDTIAPEIKTPEIITDSILHKQILCTTITDNLSGIKNYRATVNGKWLLMEYEEKSGKLSCEPDQSMLKNKFEIVIEVTDKKENKRILKTIIN